VSREGDTVKLDEWKKEVTRLMKERYGLDENDFDEECVNIAYSSGDSLADFISWYGRKYDLDAIPSSH